MRPTESAVIVPVPEAEPVVGRFRADLDRSASEGVPAHVTILFPFVPPGLIDDQVIAALAEAVASVPPFDVLLARARWFGEAVLWLAPEPDEPFRALTRAVCARFPGYLPYGGAHPDAVPHLTVGQDRDADVLHAAASAIEPSLPVRTRVAAVSLIVGSAEPGSWHSIADLPLGPPAARRPG